jgi:hypothetical protein
MTEKLIEKEFPQLTNQININQLNMAMMEGVIKICLKVENVEDESLSYDEITCLEKNFEIILKVFKY